MDRLKKVQMVESTSTDIVVHSQPKTRSGPTKNIKWTTEMDVCVTDELIIQMQKGNKIDRSFTNLAYQSACSELFVKCGVSVNADNLKNRLKTLKKDLAAFQDIQANCSGFSFNRVTRMMDAEPNVWKDYITAHPEGKPYQHKPVLCFENMVQLFGTDRATGKDAETTKERRIRLERELEESNSVTNNQACDKEVEQDDDGDSIGALIHKRQDPKSISSKVAYKRKHGATSSEDFQIIKRGMDTVASAISNSAPRVYSAEEIFEAVACVEGLDEDAQMIAYDYLCGDDIRAKAYIGLPLSRRKRWLEFKLGGLLNQKIDSTRMG